MPTKKQIAANRANAQKSTGPRTAAGKAVSSQNALQSGIDAASQVIRGEDPAALQALAARYFREDRPLSAEESALVDILVDSEWILRRLRKAEAQLWEHELADIEESHERWRSSQPFPEDQVLGRAFRAAVDTFSRLERRRDTLQRNYRRALHDLHQLRQSRPEPSPTPSAQTPDPEIGFVPQIPSGAPGISSGARPMRTPPVDRSELPDLFEPAD